MTPFEDDARKVIDRDLRFDESAGPFLLLGIRADARLLIWPRPERPRDEASPVAELGAVVAAVRPAVTTLVMPARARDLMTGDVVSRSVTLTTIEVCDGQVEMQADNLPYATGDGPRLGPTSALAVPQSPVASLLYDAVTFATDIDATDVLAALTAWGHMIMARDDLPGEPALPPASSRAIYRTRRLARELDRRHNPMASGGRPPRRPAVPTDLPRGFVPACPI